MCFYHIFISQCYSSNKTIYMASKWNLLASWSLAL